MLSYDKQRQLVIVCILGIILTVIIAGAVLFFIWKPQEVKEKGYKLGEVDLVALDSNAMLNEYYNRLKGLLQNSDLDAICDLVSDDYYKYTGKTREDIKNYLTEANVLGKSLSLSNGLVYSTIEYNNVYELNLKSDGEIYSINIIVREVAPEDYTIAFDKFIDSRENVYRGTVNSVELSIAKITRFTTSMTCTLRVTNGYHEMVTLNANGKNSAVPIVSSMYETAKNPVMCDIANQSLQIPSGMAREFDVIYNMGSVTDYMYFDVFVLDGVSYTGIEGTSGLEYYIY